MEKCDREAKQWTPLSKVGRSSMADLLCCSWFICLANTFFIMPFCYHGRYGYFTLLIILHDWAFRWDTPNPSWKPVTYLQHTQYGLYCLRSQTLLELSFQVILACHGQRCWWVRCCLKGRGDSGKGTDFINKFSPAYLIIGVNGNVWAMPSPHARDAIDWDLLHYHLKAGVWKSMVVFYSTSISQ